jgi:hypothetical protein
MSISELEALIQRQTDFIINLKKEKTGLEARVAELSAKIPATFASKQTEPLVSAAATATQTEESAAADASTQTEASAKGTRWVLFAAGTAVLAAGALAVAKNPEAAKDAAVKGGAFVAKTASSVARSVSAFFNNGIQIDLTRVLSK